MFKIGWGHRTRKCVQTFTPGWGHRTEFKNMSVRGGHNAPFSKFRYVGKKIVGKKEFAIKKIG